MLKCHHKQRIGLTSMVQDMGDFQIVNQIKCLECGRVSEREEDFLDMNVTVGGNDSLAQAFQVIFYIRMRRF